LKTFSLFICLTFSHSCLAFYEWQNSNNSAELRGLFRISGIMMNNPEDIYFYTNKRASGTALFTRLMLNGKQGNALRYEAHINQSYIPENLLTSTQVQPGIERSSKPEWSYSNRNFSHIAFDRLNFRWSKNNVDITLGRQAINLATTFYFSPNDFFAPFAAQDFYRVYKPGVDAVRAEIRISDLSQLDVISVAGYKPFAKSITGWSKKPDSDRLSSLLRFSSTIKDYDWSIITGKVRNIKILGASFQGELFDWLGLRIAGHHARPDEPLLKNYNEFTIGLEHRWENTLEARLEVFYHGNGSDTTSNYATMATDTPYLARRYSAFSLGYELTPLLNAQALLITNHIDQSKLLSLYFSYSVSDESELAVNISTTYGKKPTGIPVTSEFGAYPDSVQIEFRYYF